MELIIMKAKKIIIALSEAGREKSIDKNNKR